MKCEGSRCWHATAGEPAPRRGVDGPDRSAAGSGPLGQARPGPAVAGAAICAPRCRSWLIPKLDERSPAHEAMHISTGRASLEHDFEPFGKDLSFRLSQPDRHAGGAPRRTHAYIHLRMYVYAIGDDHSYQCDTFLRLRVETGTPHGGRSGLRALTIRPTRRLRTPLRAQPLARCTWTSNC